MTTGYTVILFSSIIVTLNLYTPISNDQTELQGLPAVLIHGYASDASVPEKWEQPLENDDIDAHSVTFSVDDECGSAADHAAELNRIVDEFKRVTEADKINIVAHSKGGLDARVYLANDLSNDDVAYFIMIGTPNRGSPLADRYSESDPCKPAVYDLKTTAAEVNQVVKNPNTEYCTIASNWNSVFVPFTLIDVNCPAPLNWLAFEKWGWVFIQNMGRVQIVGPDDGIYLSQALNQKNLVHLGVPIIVIRIYLEKKNMKGQEMHC